MLKKARMLSENAKKSGTFGNPYTSESDTRLVGFMKRVWQTASFAHCRFFFGGNENCPALR